MKINTFAAVVHTRSEAIGPATNSRRAFQGCPNARPAFNDYVDDGSLHAFALGRFGRSGQTPAGPFATARYRLASYRNGRKGRIECGGLCGAKPLRSAQQSALWCSEHQRDARPWAWYEITTNLGEQRKNYCQKWRKCMKIELIPKTPVKARFPIKAAQNPAQLMRKTPPATPISPIG